MIVQLCLAICDMEAIACNQFGSKLQIGPKVSAAMAGVCAVVGCGPGMGGSAAIRFAKRDIRSQGCAEQQIALYPHRTDVAKIRFQVRFFSPNFDFQEKLKAIGANFGFYEMNATDKTSVFAAFDKAAKELGKARNDEKCCLEVPPSRVEAKIWRFAKENHSH